MNCLHGEVANAAKRRSRKLISNSRSCTPRRGELVIEVPPLIRVLLALYAHFEDMKAVDGLEMSAARIASGDIAIHSSVPWQTGQTRFIGGHGTYTRRVSSRASPEKNEFLPGSVEGTATLLPAVDTVRQLEGLLRIGQELITQLVAAGEASLQINSNAVTVNRLKQKGAPIDWVAPGPLPGLMVGVGLTAQAPHPAAARLLVDFLLSKEGQQLYQSAGRLVARSDLPQDDSMKVRGAQIVPVDPSWAENFDEDEKLMKEIFSY
jgi:hypothetical protein